MDEKLELESAKAIIKSEVKADVSKHGVIPVESQNLTVEKLRKFLPRGSSVQVTEEIVNVLRSMEDDTGLPQNMLEQDVLSYMHMVGKQGVSIIDLANAIKFCNLKRNISNKKA